MRHNCTYCNKKLHNSIKFDLNHLCLSCCDYLLAIFYTNYYSLPDRTTALHNNVCLHCDDSDLCFRVVQYYYLCNRCIYEQICYRYKIPHCKMSVINNLL